MKAKKQDKNLLTTPLLHTTQKNDVAQRLNAQRKNITQCHFEKNAEEVQGNRDSYKKEARKQEKGKYQYKNRKQSMYKYFADDRRQ